METKKRAKSKTTAVVFVLLLLFSALLFSISVVFPEDDLEPIQCLEDDEPFMVETSDFPFYSDYVVSAGGQVPNRQDFSGTVMFYINSWNDDWQDKGIWYLVKGTGGATTDGDLITWWGVEVDRYYSSHPDWEWEFYVPIPEMILPLFAEVGPWHLEFHLTNKAIWLIEYDIHIFTYYFEVVEASLWDNIFAPYYLTWGGANILIFEIASGFTLSIPAPLAILIALVILIIIIKVVIPLWISIPSAANTKKKKRIGGVVVGRSFKGG